MAGYFYSSGRADRADYAVDGRYRQENFYRSRSWLRQRPEVHISINLSVDDLRSPTLPTLLHDQLQHWGIAAEQIILEITERGFVDPETTMPVIAHYRQAGHRISIDDFGTGYSSLSYLQKLDVDTLKIDKSLSIPSSTGR
nr:EAL domain-containing protein [Klebsiella pneumoniae subsp. pneumoniae]